MSMYELVKLALTALIRNRLRSILTVLGIVIGVAAVVALVSFGTSYQTYVNSQFSGIGASSLFISSTNPKGVKAKPLTMGDAQAIANPQNVGGVEAVAPVFNTSGTLVANSTSMSQSITGTTEAYATVRSQSVSSGRFVTITDVNNQSMVAVIGSAIVTKLFPDGNAVGQPMKINGQLFTVVGVLQSTGGGQGNQDRVVIVPITTAQIRLGGDSARTPTGEYRVAQVILKTSSTALVNAAKADITALMTARHQIQYVGQEDFNVFSQGAIQNTLDNVLGLLTLFLGMIAGISLLVGGIGVMNIMLVSVTERTREIGLRKALGANYSDLLLQFLIESVSLCILGGLLGVALGVAVALIGGLLLPTFPIAVSIPAIVLAVAVSTAIGVFFGLYPASRAALMKPIEALRHE